MPFQTHGEVKYFQFEEFGQGIEHAILTRQGGVSPRPWESLNLGSTVGDDLDRVRRNRSLALAVLDKAPDSVFDVWQVHGTEAAIAEAPRPQDSPHPQADIILTDRLKVTLMMRFADCVPVLLHDPVRRVVGLAHAGWMGTVRGTVSVAVKAMQGRFGSAAADIQAAIGPSIGPDHYQIGPDVAAQVRQAFGHQAGEFLFSRDGSTYFDLWKANTWLLEQAGVHQIERAGLCTACHTEDWFSHRAEKGQTGRFGAVIALKDN
jgi:YfiH family protein